MEEKRAKFYKADVVTAAKELRKELKRNFPDKFSVRIKRTGVSSSINVQWHEGTAKPKVEKIAQAYEKVDRDSKTGEILLGGNRYVFCERSIDDETLEKIKREIKKRVSGFGDWNRDPGYRMEVFRYIANTDL